MKNNDSEKLNSIGINEKNNEITLKTLGSKGPSFNNLKNLIT